MDEAQTEKLKALALAYSYENGEHWFNEFELADGVTYEPGVNFIIAANPATVLALIAEVERLRADAERFQKATMFEDNAEALYAAVLNHAPDGAAIREEFDAAIAASKERV